MNNSISFDFQFSNFYCNSYSFDEFTSTYSFDVISNKKTSDIICPRCGAKVHVYDSSTVHLKDMPLRADRSSILKVHLHRYRCTSCKVSFSEEIPFKHPGSRVTGRLSGFIKSFLKHHMSIKDIAAITGVHWETISKIHKQYMEELLEERATELSLENYHPRYLAVDEFAIHKGHTYATCVMDIERGDVLWVGKGRAINDFIKFFQEIPVDYLSDVEAVAMDMNASYNRLVEENLPNAEIVYDRYHFQAQYGKDVLGSVRLEEARIHQERATQIKEILKDDMPNDERNELKRLAKVESSLYSKLKRARWTLLKNGTNLEEDNIDKLKGILENHSNLAVCYAMKEEMIRLYGLTDVKEARDGWLCWFEAAKQSGIPQLQKFAKLKEKRLPGLIAHAQHNISTGKLEGFNNKIKVAKRIGYGYRNDEHFFTMIKYLSLPATRNQSPRNP